MEPSRLRTFEHYDDKRSHDFKSSAYGMPLCLAVRRAIGAVRVKGSVA